MSIDNDTPAPAPSPSAARTSPRMAVLVACIALFTDMLVYGILIPILPLMPAVTEAGPAAAGMLFAAYAAAMIVITPVAGRLVDRHGPRGPLLGALIGLAASCALFAIGSPYWLLLCARILQGLAAGLGWVSSLALIAATIPLAKRGTSMGAAMSMISLGTLAGPPISGWLAHHWGHVAPFAFATVILLIDGVLRVIFIKDTPAQSDDPATALDVARAPGSIPVIVLILLGSLVTASIEPILPTHLAADFGLDSAAIGVLFAVVVLVGAVLNPLVGSLLGRVSVRALVTLGALMAVGAFLLLGFGGSMATTVSGLALSGAAVALLGAPASVLIGVQGMKTNPPALGGAYGLYNLAYAGGMMIGPALAGALTGSSGFTVACGALAGLVALGSLVTVPGLPHTLRTGPEASRRAGAANPGPPQPESSVATDRARSSGQEPHHDAVRPATQRLTSEDAHPKG